MEGKIIRGIAGFYYVYVSGIGVLECKAKGIFRKNNVKPLVGDFVEVTLLDEEKKKGNIEQILKRKNELIRPAVANIDQAMVIFAIKKPAPNLNLLDRFLIMMQQKEIPCILVFNKNDLSEQEEKDRLYHAYKDSGCEILFVSAKQEMGIEAIKEKLHGKTTTVAGPSGVGKSSIINQLQSHINMETGDLSEKIERGKHTTRHTEFIPIGENTFILDTPGFSSLAIFDIEKEELEQFYPEFAPYREECRFHGCSHTHEPGCSVKEALEQGRISVERYENYKQMYEELKNKKKY